MQNYREKVRYAIKARCNADIKEKRDYRHLMPTASLQSFKFVAVKVLGKKLL